jgi:hypothetical protein
VSCDDAKRTFTIICFPAFNGRRLCSDSAFIGDHIGAQISYPIELLKDRDAVFDAVGKLIISFERPSAER